MRAPEALVRQLRTEAETITSMRRDHPGYGTSPIFLREAADTIEALQEKVERVVVLTEEGHNGQHEPGPDLHGWMSNCWPCEIAKALNGR